MKAHTLTIITALLLATGFSANAQMGQGSAPRSYNTAPTNSTPSYSGGGSTYSSSPSQSTPSCSAPSSDTYRGNSSSGSSGSSSDRSGSTSGSGSSGSGSGSYSTGSNNNGYGYNNNGYGYNNNGYGYNNGGYSSSPGNSGNNSNVSSGGSASTSPAYYPQQVDAETVRNNSLSDIRKSLSAFDQTKQTFTVSGTEPSTVTGLGGTIMNINPADLVTADGQPISGDIKVELKELDAPGKMALAGAPTMSNGDVLISGGSYYFGMSAGGQELKLKEGKSMEVQLPQLVDAPDMQVYMGEVDKNGNVNWQPTGRPLNGMGVAQGTDISDLKNPPRQNNEGGNNTGSGSNTTPTGPRTNGGSNNNGGGLTNGGSNNNNSNNGGVRNNNTGNAFAYYSPTTINNLGWVNCDKGFRGGVKMFVEVEGVDPTNTQVFVMYKNVKSLVEGKPEQGFSTNNFIFTNIPNNQPVKIVAISKANGVTYTGTIEAKTKARAKFLVPLTKSTDADAAKLFE